MQFKRWITAIIALPVLFYLIGFGNRIFLYAFLFIVSFVGLAEFYKITDSLMPAFIRYSGHLLSLLLFTVIYRGQISVALIIVSFWAIIPMIYYLFMGPGSDRKDINIGAAVLGPVYVSVPLSLLLPIDRLYLIHYPIKGAWIFFLLTIIFASDTGAFYFGRTFGKHKLYEAVSPKKTWEGAIGGLMSSVIAGIVFLRFVPIHPLDLNIILLVIILSIMGQIGDLAESMLKRTHGIKDSGGILPGHGGVLDRIDGLLFAIPPLYLFLVWGV